MTMVAHSHAGILNASELGRALGYSYHTIQNALDLLEGYFLARRLQPYHANLGKRIVKSPKLYLRDSGILHHLLGISTTEELLSSPARGNSFEGFMIEQIIALENLHHPGSGFYYFRTQTGTEIDLIIDRGQVRIGCEFKAGVSVNPEDWKHLKAGINDGVIQRGAEWTDQGQPSNSGSQLVGVLATRLIARLIGPPNAGKIAAATYEAKISGRFRAPCRMRRC